MQPAKVNVLIGQFCYAGNGGFASILPHIGDWWAKVYHEMMVDDRIDRVAKVNLADTPVTMTRNRLLHQAVAGGFDMVLLIDSDNEPDLYVGHDSAAKPFWQTSFDFAYRRLTQGLPTCIAAPYCGPPPHPINGGEENVYVFKWKNWESDNPHYSGAEVVAYDRTEAALMTGIAPAAALPTGLLLLTTKALESINPPYFRYEWKDAWEDQKASTEDVYFTRNLAMAGRMKWGAPIVFANWDAWAGHHKPKCVGKPVVLRVEQVCETFAEAVRNNIGQQERMIFVNPEMGDAEREKLILEGGCRTGKSVADELPGEVEMRNGHQFKHLGWRSSIEDRYVLEMVVQQLPDDQELVGVEVGSWVGDSALTILNAKPLLKLHCVDTFKGSETDTTGDIARDLEAAARDDAIVFKTFLTNMAPYDGRYSVFAGTSARAVECYEAESLDFLNLDAGHAYPEVKANIEEWLPKLKRKPHAIIAGHDYNDPQFPGVKKAVDEAFGDKVQYRCHVWYVKPYAETEPQATWSDELSDIDAKHLEEFLDVWNKGGNPKRILYCGVPDFPKLRYLVSAARGGRVFCAVENAMLSETTAQKAEGVGVKMVAVDDLATADFWNGDEVDLVFLHESALRKEVADNAALLLASDGIMIGTVAPDQYLPIEGHVERWNEGCLWAKFMGETDDGSYQEGGENYDPPDESLEAT